MVEVCRVYEQPVLRQVAGNVLRPGGLALTRHALTVAALPPGARVLDLGCGVGTTTAVCGDEFDLDAVGLDVSAGMLTEAHGQHRTLPLVQAAGARLPFRGGALDAVLAECVLAIIPDLDSALADIRRVLRDGGLLIVSDLYARAPDGVSGLRNLPLASCLRGALSRTDFEAKVMAHGFTLILWEDYTEALKHFTARLILEHGSLANFWQCAAGNSAAEPIQQAIRHARPGYFLAVARNGSNNKIPIS
ncbi:MAG: methyltransferase domain-containing protein [Anaerolineae bacterium]|nr:methyltransferase domain-containing protein [Anaerolineae bacterium]